MVRTARLLVLSAIFGSMVLAVSFGRAAAQEAAPAAAAPPAPAPGGFLPPIPIDANLHDKTKGNRDAATAKSRIISGNQPFDAQAQADLRTYFEGYLFKAMTHPEKFGDIQDDIRKATLNDIRNASTRSRELHDFLTNLVFTQMRPLVEQNHHPIVRVNAALFIGELNAEERGTTTPAPTPLPQALAYLREQLASPTQIDSVRVASLAGIQRHVEATWILEKRLSDDVITGLAQEMTALLTSECPANRSPAAHAWIRGRAADVLGGICGWIPNEPAFQALAGVLAVPDNPVSLRCRAAYAMSRVKYDALPNAAQVNWPEVAGNLAGLLADACKLETTLIDAEKKKLAAGSGSFGSPGSPGVPGMPSGDGDGGMAPPGEPGGVGGGGVGGMGLGGGKGPGAGGGFGGMMSGMGGMGGMGYYGGASSMLGGLPAYKVDGSRRRLLYGVACVRAALGGPTKDADLKGIRALAQANATASPMVTKLEQAIADIDKVVNVSAKELKLDDVLKKIRTRGQELEQLRPVTEKASATDAPSDVPAGDAPSSPAPK